MTSAAVLSDCGFYRYTLTRVWNVSLPRLVFIMLNPSTADASVNDNTIRRCIRFGQDMGYGSIEVVNLFAFRATNPDDLMQRGYPVGPDNDRYVLEAITRADAVICAWGTFAQGHPRIREVLDILQLFGVQPLALELTAQGHPKHPLYIRADARPVPL